MNQAEVDRSFINWTDAAAAATRTEKRRDKMNVSFDWRPYVQL